MLSLLSDHSSKSNASSTICPGGYFILREAEERARLSTSIGDKTRWWYDIALTTEFKKGESLEERHDNVSRIIFNIQQTMTLDPCRRFAFGITVENTGMRLWFCSRATPVVSEVFNFTTEVDLLTHIFLSIAFASKEHLDCSAVLKWIHGCGWVHRDISVGNLYYFNGRGLIGDLEYAKRSNSKVLDESRTGTPEFIQYGVQVCNSRGLTHSHFLVFCICFEGRIRLGS
ncbi:hypothetical protein ACEPAH_3068 [Sanghuangporus vaninii]